MESKSAPAQSRFEQFKSLSALTYTSNRLAAITAELYQMRVNLRSAATSVLPPIRIEGSEDLGPYSLDTRHEDAVLIHAKHQEALKIIIDKRIAEIREHLGWFFNLLVPKSLGKVSVHDKAPKIAMVATGGQTGFYRDVYKFEAGVLTQAEIISWREARGWEKVSVQKRFLAHSYLVGLFGRDMIDAITIGRDSFKFGLTRTVDHFNRPDLFVTPEQIRQAQADLLKGSEE